MVDQRFESIDSGAFSPAGDQADGAGAGGDQAPAQVGFFGRIWQWFANVFGIGQSRGTTLTTSQRVARNVARAVAAGVATQVAAELAKSTGSKTAGTISKAVVRGALGGVMRR